MVFGETLPGLWWVGAAGLVVGNVVIGRRDEEDASEAGKDGRAEEERRERYRDSEHEEDGSGISDGVELEEDTLKQVGEER